ncbi:hypothetical protein J3F83DRAFT_367939 [Trichoderma novae-zelandiae]
MPLSNGSLVAHKAFNLAALHDNPSLYTASSREANGGMLVRILTRLFRAPSPANSALNRWERQSHTSPDRTNIIADVGKQQSFSPLIVSDAICSNNNSLETRPFQLPSTTYSHRIWLIPSSMQHPFLRTLLRNHHGRPSFGPAEDSHPNSRFSAVRSDPPVPPSTRTGRSRQQTSTNRDPSERALLPPEIRPPSELKESLHLMDKPAEPTAAGNNHNALGLSVN